MSETLHAIPQNQATGLIRELGPQLPARSQELNDNPAAIQSLLIRRIIASSGQCPGAPALNADNLQPDQLWQLEFGLIGGVIISEYTKALLTHDGPQAQFRPDVVQRGEDRYTPLEWVEPTLLEQIDALGKDVDSGLRTVADKLVHVPRGSWLHPYIVRYNTLAASNTASTATDTYKALTNSSIVDTTTDLIELVNESPFLTKGKDGSTEPFAPSSDQKRDAALDLVYLIGARSSMHLKTFFQAVRLKYLRGNIVQLPGTNEELPIQYVFHPTDRGTMKEIFPHTSVVAPEVTNQLLIKCHANQYSFRANLPEQSEPIPRFTNIQLQARAIIRLAADRNLFES